MLTSSVARSGLMTQPLGDLSFFTVAGHDHQPNVDEKFSFYEFI